MTKHGLSCYNMESDHHALAILGGHTQRTPPQGTQFFHFDIQILRNIAALGVHAPLRSPRPPLREILGSATAMVLHWSYSSIYFCLYLGIATDRTLHCF